MVWLPFPVMAGRLALFDPAHTKRFIRLVRPLFRVHCACQSGAYWLRQYRIPQEDTTGLIYQDVFRMKHFYIFLAL